MISKVAISGYRSLRDVTLPLGQLTIITGANGTGKSSVYKSLRLLADIADGRIISSIAREGGFDSICWAGPEKISRGMRDGSVPIQGTVRQGPVSLKLGFTEDDLSYSIELGLPVPVPGSMFARDPVIKREVYWMSQKPTPSKIIADRRGPGVRVKDNRHKPMQIATSMSPHDSMIREIVGEHAPWELAVLRRRLSAWRFYDHIRTDEDAPARMPQVGTRTTTLDPSGSDIAAAIQTIIEIGDRDALDAAIDLAFSGARLHVHTQAGLFQLLMSQHGMLRSLNVSELSDGTLRFILLAAALLTPRPPPLLVLNEPESSLHSSVIPALATLITRVSEDTQVVVVSHNRTLVTSLLDADATLVELYKETGETFIDGDVSPHWQWPAR
ncbi:MAG: AAA family ATPase [Pseudomonadota bacterium]